MTSGPPYGGRTATGRGAGAWQRVSVGARASEEAPGESCFPECRAEEDVTVQGSRRAGTRTAVRTHAERRSPHDVTAWRHS